MLRRIIVSALGAASLCADIVRGLVDSFAPPRSVEAIATQYRDDVIGADPPAWVRAVRADLDAEIASNRKA